MLVMVIWYLCFRAFGVYRSQRQAPLSRILWQYIRAVSFGILLTLPVWVVAKNRAG
jgi:hypothetical protein